MKKPRAMVIGGGPAGASAALGLLRSGRDVTLFEQRSAWQGRVCGAFLNPEAVNHLRWLKVWEEAQRAGAVSVPSARITTPRGTETPVDTRQKEYTSLGLPRQALEEILLEAVKREGGDVRLGARVESFEKRDEGWCVSVRLPDGEERFSCSLLVLADGRFTQGVPDSAKPSSGWFGWNAAFEGVPQNPGDLSLHFYPGGYVGVLTFADGGSNVCGLHFKKEEAHKGWEEVFDQALREQPALRRLLSQARRQSPWRGVGPLPFTQRMRASQGPLLAGDAAAVGDPFMGEGIGRALGAGPMLFQATKNLKGSDSTEDLLRREYQRLWNRHYNPRLKLGNLARRILGSNRLFTPVWEGLLRFPKALGSLVPLFHRGFGAHSKKTPDESGNCES